MRRMETAALAARSARQASNYALQLAPSLFELLFASIMHKHSALALPAPPSRPRAAAARPMTHDDDKHRALSTPAASLPMRPALCARLSANTVKEGRQQCTM